MYYSLIPFYHSILPSDDKEIANLGSWSNDKLLSNIFFGWFGENEKDITPQLGNNLLGEYPIKVGFHLKGSEILSTFKKAIV